MCACVRACVFAMFKLSILMHFKNRQNLYNKIILQGVSMTRKKIQWMDITVVHCLWSMAKTTKRTLESDTRNVLILSYNKYSTKN